MEKEIKIELQHIENPKNEQVRKVTKAFLEAGKKLGLWDFKKTIQRKCDYCEKRLQEGDDFVTEFLENGDILDKCSECEKNGK